MSVCLCMIVKNEEENLPHCLDSVKGLFDELIIVDTGSTDATVKIAKRYGARTFFFPWIDDFAAARNFGLDRVRSDYVARMDADDRLFSGHRKRLAALLAALDPRNPAAYSCRVRAAEHSGAFVLSDEYRIWPNRPSIRFHGRIHERLHLERDARDISILPSHCRIDHHGYADEALYLAKLRRNLAILEQVAKSAESLMTDSLLRFDLARTHAALGNHEAAIGWFESYLTVADPAHAISVRSAFRQLAGIHCGRGDAREAMRAARAGLAKYPDDTLLLGVVADMLRNYGELDLAAEGYRKILEHHRDDRMDAGVPTDFRARVARALAEVEAMPRLATAAPVPAPASAPPPNPSPHRGAFVPMSLS